jgi:hypothetical protein
LGPWRSDSLNLTLQIFLLQKLRKFFIFLAIFSGYLGHWVNAETAIRVLCEFEKSRTRERPIPRWAEFAGTVGTEKVELQMSIPRSGCCFDVVAEMGRWKRFP